MDERHEPERIEIELTSHDPASTRRSRVSTAGAPEPAGEPSERGPGWLESEQGRLVAVAAFVAVVGVLLGVVIGGRTGGDAAAEPRADVSETSVAPTTTSPPTTLETRGDTLPPAELDESPPPPTASLESTDVFGTTPGASAPILLPESLAGRAIELVVQSTDGNLVIIELATGDSSRIDGLGVPPAGPGLIAGDQWVLFPQSFGGSSLVVEADGDTTRFDLGGDGPLIWVSGTDRFWRVNQGGASTATGVRMEEVRLDGSETGASMEVPGWPQASDPLGGVVIVGTGGTYRVDGDVAERITTGQLLGLTATAALVYDCDASLVCRYALIDRTTGDARLIEVSGLDGGVLQPFWWYFPTLTTSAIQPGPTPGRALVSIGDRGFDDQPNFGVLDLETGALTALGDGVSGVQSAQWSPDGSAIVWLDGRGVLWAHDVETATSTEFASGLGPFVAFGLRSVLPSVDDDPPTAPVTTVPVTTVPLTTVPGTTVP